jgi:hypothetical protein
VPPLLLWLKRGENSGDLLGVVAAPALVFARNSVNRELGLATVGADVSSFFGLGKLSSEIANIES